MVRFYCLTSIKKISAKNIDDNIQSTELDEYISNYYGNNTTKTMEKIKDNPEIFNNYQLTEISIGYSINSRTNERIFLMFYYRKDNGLIVFPMIKGAVKFHSISNLLHEFFVATSKLFPDILDFDLQIKVRCIKNTQVRGPMTKEEEEYYENYSKQIEAYCKNDRDLQETAFEKFLFILPNSSKPNVLRQKLSDINMLVKLLCDDNTGNFANISMDARYSQKVKCSFLEQQSEKATDNQQLSPSPSNFVTSEDHNMEENFESKIRTLNGSCINDDQCGSIDVNFKKSLNFSSSNKKRGRPRFQLDEKNRKPAKNIAQKYYHEKMKRSREALYKEMEIIEQQNRDLKKAKQDLLQRTYAQINYCPGILKDLQKNAYMANVYRSARSYNTSLNNPESQGEISYHVEKIILQNCNLIQCPDFDIIPISVTILDLSNNCISSIPNSISQLINLTVFNVSGNQNLGNSGFPWMHLPLSIMDLNIQKTNIICVPPSIQRLEKLKFLYVGNDCFKNIAWECISDTVEEIKIKYSKINAIGNIPHLTTLSSLKAKSNHIYYISDTITTLQALTELELKNNELSFLPNGFENLTSLKYLNLSKNKFNYENENLADRLWKRLPLNISVLILNDNNLQVLPCHLQNYRFCYLAVNNCSLKFICPYFLTKHRNNELFLEMVNNPEFQNLPVIPRTIYQQLTARDSSLKASLSYLNFLTDNEAFVISSKLETFEFKYCKEVAQSCKCCACCGKQTTENMRKQILIMDFNLCLSKANNEQFFLQTSVNEKQDDKIKSYREKFSRKVDRVYSSGQWKTNIKTRLCFECLHIVRTEINTVQNVYQQLHKPNNETINTLEPSMPILVPQSSFADGNAFSQSIEQNKNNTPFCLEVEINEPHANKKEPQIFDYPERPSPSKSIEIKSEFSNSDMPNLLEEEMNKKIRDINSMLELFSDNNSFNQSLPFTSSY